MTTEDLKMEDAPVEGGEEKKEEGEGGGEEKSE